MYMYMYVCMFECVYVCIYVIWMYRCIYICILVLYICIFCLYLYRRETGLPNPSRETKFSGANANRKKLFSLFS